MIAGLPVAEAAFAASTRRFALTPLLHGRRAGSSPAVLIAEVEGPLASILSAERVALNFLQRLSGIATLTRALVDAVDGPAGRASSTRARRRRACARWSATPCASAAATTTASTWPTAS